LLANVLTCVLTFVATAIAMDFPRRELLDHVSGRENLCLNTIRQTKSETWQHSIISDSPAPAVYVEIKDGSNVFPLYLYPDRNDITQERRPNFSPELLKDLTAKLGLGQVSNLPQPNPETIFYYIYAIFHSPTYRSRYAEFLKIDFPRVPLTRDVELFQQSAAYGKQLVALHLMKSPQLDTLITKFEGTPAPGVDPGHPKFLLPSPSGRGVGGEGKVIINKQGDGFTGVPQAVWEFYIGGYQVCQKWLKDRKGRTLTPEDITHYQRIIVALQETIRLLQQIDEAIPGFPIE